MSSSCLWKKCRATFISKISDFLAPTSYFLYRTFIARLLLANVITNQLGIENDSHGVSVPCGMRIMGFYCFFRAQEPPYKITWPVYVYCTRCERKTGSFYSS